MYVNPANPHHGVDCICDSCWRYWGQYARTMAKAVAAQRSTEQAIESSGLSCDPTFDESGDKNPPLQADNVVSASVSESERDCSPDSQEGNRLTFLSGCGMIHMKSNGVEWAPPEKIGRPDYEIKNVEGVYQVVDCDGFVVCECSRRHNAGLICHLLNQHT